MINVVYDAMTVALRGPGSLLPRSIRRHPKHRRKQQQQQQKSLLSLRKIGVFSLLFAVLYVFSLASLTTQIHSESVNVESPGKLVVSQKKIESHAHPKGYMQGDWDWDTHTKRIEKWFDSVGKDDVPMLTQFKPITAYLEPALNISTSATERRGLAKDGSSIAPKYYEPLSLRTQSPDLLQKVVYPRLASCHDLPAKLPVDRGVQYDPASGEPLVTNVGDQATPLDFLEQRTPHCPVDADPFLPWIHDVFLDVSNSSVRFVAQNKRRCQTGSTHGPDIERLEPQAALLQSVSVERISDAEAARLAPGLWNSPTTPSATRYRLAPYATADHDAKYTRFICRFHTWDLEGQSRRLELGETLSEYPLNYELAAFRKLNNFNGLATRQGKDNAKFWTSSLLFSCPLPSNPTNSGPIQWTTDRTNIPLVHVDIIPIRTPVRFPLYGRAGGQITDNGYYLSEEQIGRFVEQQAFNATAAWGYNHVLPMIQASGRWENLPICPVTKLLPIDDTPSPAGTESVRRASGSKPYLLSACLWASATFLTRGKDRFFIGDTKDRLREWLEFHLLVGFDHIYVYDNSGAFGNDTNLSDITNMFPTRQVTRLEWPSQVCNNNVPAHDNTGERSSQYAAENSCRSRYGPLTEWIVSFDTDEYLVPQGKHTNLRTIVEQASDTNILSFRSSRGKLRHRYSKTIPKGRVKMTNATFLQAFNCDGSSTPRPAWADRARKQLYRADYVLNHFVHYSTVTMGHMMTHKEAQKKGQPWSRFFEESPPSERVTNEETEALMIHTKSLDFGQTTNWKNRCKFDFKKKFLGCFIGFPWPNNQQAGKEGKAHDPSTGLIYNCYENESVDQYWAPQLETAMAKRRGKN